MKHNEYEAHAAMLDAVAKPLPPPRALPQEDGVILVNAASLQPEPVRWLWPGWLARGKLHILAGAPGQGKTTIALALAATVSCGGRWPGGMHCEPGQVLVWSGEDDAADTLLPRLLAMGAKASRINFITGTRDGGEVCPFDPSRDLVSLATAAQGLGHVAMVIVDPVVSTVAKDSNSQSDVRKGLQPLVDVAQVLDAAVLGIAHFSKGTAGRDPTERVTGSVAFGAVARVVMVAAKVARADGDRRVFARSKSNIGPDDGGFEYAMVQATVPDHADLVAATIQWGEAMPGTARELLADAEAQVETDEESSALSEAISFLEDELADGPAPVKKVRSEARAAGHADRTMDRAKSALHIRATKQSAGWVWSLPGKCAKGANISDPQKDGALGALAPQPGDCPW